MEYTALYRKLRPKNFSEVCGQEHIIKTLRNQLIADRVSHAYLFCGTRGTGKTSTAKIFAKAINCLDLHDGEPCNECEMCRAIDENRSFNIFEIDAASNNGVDNIRSLRDEVEYPPAQGKYKVYIIDEVHMLSLAAFNALLKTLEEPPAHVVFILATTDPQKVPVTILSRCQRFDFKRISGETISKTLLGYMKEENIDITEEAVNVIAGVSDGAMRDALSILDRCISFYYGERITADKVLEVMGAADKSMFFELTDAICGFDTLKALSVIRDVFESGRDLNRFINELVTHLRNVLLAKQNGRFTLALDYSEENTERLRLQGAGIEQNRLIELISLFSEFLNDTKYTDNIKIALEVFIVRITNPIADGDSSLLARVEELEKIASENFLYMERGTSQAVAPVKQTPQAEKQAEKKPEIKEKAVPEDIKRVIHEFGRLKKHFDLPSERAFIGAVTPGCIGDRLYLVCPHPGCYDYITEKTEDIKKALADIFKKEFEPVPILREDYDRRHMQIYGRADETAGEGLNDKQVEDIKSMINFEVDVED